MTISMTNIDGVKIHPQKQILTHGGDIFHAMKKSDSGYNGFGEAYFSTIEPGFVKAWKRHNKMTLNIVVPKGIIRFVIYDNRNLSKTKNKFFEVTLSQKNYFRLTIPPKVWFGFQCLDDETSILLNIANIPHLPSEVLKKDICDIDFDWKLKE